MKWIGSLLVASALVICNTTVHAQGVLHGETIQILGINEPYPLLMQKLLPQLEKELGGKIQFKLLPFDGLRQKVLLDAQNSESSVDIVMVDVPQFGEYKDILMDLNPKLAEKKVDTSDIFPSVLAAATRGKEILGLPLAVQVEMLAYRKDIFEEAGIAPPTTTDDVLGAAAKLHKKDGMAGICWNAKQGTPMGQTFLQVMGGSFGTPVIKLASLQDGNFDTVNVTGGNMHSNLDSAGAKKTADYINQILKYSPPDILNMSWAERSRTFAQGGCAMIYEWTSLTSGWESDPKSPAYHKTAYLPHPIGPGGKGFSTLGGWSLAIPKNINPKRANFVFDALVALTSSEVTRQLVSAGGCVSNRYSVSNDPELQKNCPSMGPISKMVADSRVALWQRPQVSELQQIVDVLGSEFAQMIAGSETAKDALSNSQRLIDRIMQRAGHY